MRLFIAIIALALILGYAFGGRLTRLERLHLRWWWLVIVGLGVQFLPLPEGNAGNDLLVRTGVLALSYALLLSFAIANVRLPGVPLIALGLACNALVIVVNGGMPVSEQALKDSGQEEVAASLARGGADKHHLLDESEDSLTFLADVIPIPPPIEQVMSVGDVFVYLGLIWLVVWAMRARIPEGTRSEPPLHRGKHRRGGKAAHGPPAASPPPAATTWGSGR